MHYGLAGDGSYENANFLLIDPLKEMKVSQNFLFFFKEFEKEAKVANKDEVLKKGSWFNFRIQIYHF